MKTFTFYADAGHAWLAVRVTDLEDIGLTVQEFSPYSYRNGGTLYLEEDCDAGVFIRQWQSIHGGFAHKVVDHGTRSRIRSFDRLPADTSNDIWF
jgi:hypothetical protein